MGALSVRKRRTDSRSISWSASNSKSTAAPRELADTNVRKLPCAAMRLQYAPEDEAFRSEFIAWLEANQPSDEQFRAPKQSSTHMVQWARDWQLALFEAGWLVPGWPTELGGRNATATQQMIYFEEVSRSG